MQRRISPPVLVPPFLSLLLASSSRAGMRWCTLGHSPVWRAGFALFQWTPTVSTVQGSKTSQVYCSFHLGFKLSKVVRVRIHLGPYLATQYAPVLPREPLVVFGGRRLLAPWIPTSKIPKGGLHSCLAVGCVSLMKFADSSKTWYPPSKQRRR